MQFNERDLAYLFGIYELLNELKKIEELNNRIDI